MFKQIKIELTKNQKHYFRLQGAITWAGNNQYNPELSAEKHEKFRKKYHNLCVKLRRN